MSERNDDINARMNNAIIEMQNTVMAMFLGLSGVAFMIGAAAKVIYGG